MFQIHTANPRKKKSAKISLALSRWLTGDLLSSPDVIQTTEADRKHPSSIIMMFNVRSIIFLMVRFSAPRTEKRKYSDEVAMFCFAFFIQKQTKRNTTMRRERRALLMWTRSFHISLNRRRPSRWLPCDKLFDRVMVSLSVVPFNVCRDLRILRKSICLLSFAAERLVNVCPVIRSWPVLRRRTWNGELLGKDKAFS